MAISLASLQTSTRKPPRILIYGGEGTGKTTFAICEHAPQSPDSLPGKARDGVVVIQTEDGLGDIQCQAFPIANTYEDVEEAMGALYAEQHSFDTLVIDSIDWLEPLVWDYICRTNGWDSIEKPGYGKGYAEADYIWRRFFSGINALRDDKGMTIILIAHQQIITIEEPDLPAYQSAEIKLHKRAAAITKEYVDVIVQAKLKTFVTSDSTAKATGKKGEEVKRQLATTTGQRVIVTQPKPGATAKNRYHLPAELPLDWSAFAAAMQTTLNRNTYPTKEENLS